MENPNQVTDWAGEERRHLPPPHAIYRYVDEEVEKAFESKLRNRSVSEFHATMVLILLVLIGGGWGLRLESRIETLTFQLNEQRVITSRGILPIAEERLNTIIRRLDELERAKKN